MTDEQSVDPQREIERLAAELERKERENDELKQEMARTKSVQDDLWSHDIYLKARRTMFGGVIAVLTVVGAFGLYTIDDLYKRGLNYVEDQMNKTVTESINAKVKEMIVQAGPKLDEQVNQQIGTLVEKKQLEISSLIADTKTKVDEEIAELREAFKLDRVALSDQARQIRIGITALAKVESVKTELPQVNLSCDPKFLDDAQIVRVGVRQFSVGTGKFVRNGREVFENTLFLDVRDTAGALEASCILDAVDRVVYGADPKWYSPSEFVRIDRENEFRFTVSGWGPTVLTAQVYFIGRRDPESFAGNLKISKVAAAEKKYLGDVPLEFQ